MKKIFFLLLLSLTTGCIVQSPQTALDYYKAIKTLEKTPEPKENKITLRVGERMYLRQVLNDFNEGIFNDFFEGQFDWIVDDPGIANTTRNYYLVGSSPGKTMLTGKRKFTGSWFKVEVYVVGGPYAVKLKLPSRSIKAKVGETLKLNVSVEMSDGTTSKDIIWDNVDERVCKINDNGDLTALRAGTTKITAIYSLDSKISDSAIVTVVSN